jgi:uncharacterized membrane protein
MKRSTSAERWALLGFWALLLSAVGSTAQTPTFSVQVLRNTSGGVVVYVSGINNAGEAVGSAGEGTSACPYDCAIIWHDGRPTVLEVEAEFGSQAIAINTAGQVVGEAYTAEILSPTAVVWNHGTPTFLPGPNPQFPQTYVNSINDAGKVVGEASEVNVNIPETEAIEWSGLTPTVLGTSPACTDGTEVGVPTAINRDGIIVGYTGGGHLCDEAVATVWRGTTAVLLGIGEPSAINNAGLIVGQSVATPGATAWVDGVSTPLPGTSDLLESMATAVNNLGIIVGTIQGSDGGPPWIPPYHAVLWSSVSATPQDLNDLISTEDAAEYLLIEATGINDGCTIVVNGYTRRNYAQAAFLLKPTDPSSCVNGVLAPKPRN